MEKLVKLFDRFKTKERILLIIAFIILFTLSIDRILVTPFFRSIRETKEQLEMQKKLLGRYYSFISLKDHHERLLTELELYYADLQEKFLVEDTESLAFAKLHETVSNIARKNGLTVSRSTALKKEVINNSPYLVALSVNIEVYEINSARDLQNFLYDVEYKNDKILFIDNLRIKTLGHDTIRGATISSTLTAIACIEKRL